MGMSIDQGPSIDLATIIAGGDDLMKRMAAFKEAKENAETALANLQLGKDAQLAYAEARQLIEGRQGEGRRDDRDGRSARGQGAGDD
jgi:hypothetical protein